MKTKYYVVLAWLLVPGMVLAHEGEEHVGPVETHHVPNVPIRAVQESSPNWIFYVAVGLGVALVLIGVGLLVWHALSKRKDQKVAT